ncbi:amino acid ABC transporter permease [Spirochaeta isovalerica]|uniref:General L-amino acid transport system permease protein n=1 Tax=Spirochaeta isovalerica TaxID=150 RepID=A0A841R8A1_9SPIO|nr:amino acid ABC transporter permease [Spirochaeta isovalerica]MBB6479591.1 general L-amino acid transport system permease protein [Spirochaeta isovalerica]
MKLNKIRKDYFNTPLNALMTLVMIYLIARFAWWFLNWAILDAVWIADTKDQALESGRGGATWAFIINKLRFFIFGFYPKDEIWRIYVTFFTIVLSFIPYFIKGIRHKVIIFLAHMVIWPVLIFAFMGQVSTNDWGGLSLTFILSLLGLLYSFPIGMLLALGRRSTWPIIRGLSVAYIEFFRGIPLITILFMSSVVVPFFLPSQVAVDKIVRVVIGMTFFQSAYLAEVIRGGLQAIPKGQYEASDALGFRFGLQTYLVIMPQVLKVTISNIGGISISFIKDTTLVLIIGMFDLLGIVNPLASDSNWLGMEPEGLIFAGIVYWIICFAISRLTSKAETKMNELPDVGVIK